MIDGLIRGALNNRALVLFFAGTLLAYGIYVGTKMPVDIFPDLTSPTVTILTEAHGMAPEEVETLVTFPIENTMNGMLNVRRVRSQSSMGVSVVWIEFDWSTEIYQARQSVTERLSLAASQLPPGTGTPVMMPVTSIMGEIMFLAMTSDKESSLDLRTQADWVVRRRLTAVPGIAQVFVLGGDTRQYQIRLDSRKLVHYNLSSIEVKEKITASNHSVSAGFLVENQQQFLIRGLGRANSLRDLERTVVAYQAGVPVVLSDIAEVTIGAAFRLGAGGYNAEDAVILGVQKQPGANTLELTRAIDEEINSLSQTLPEGMAIHRDIFRQAGFIQLSIDNVIHAIRDGALLVIVILWLFLVSIRATIITLVAIPLSLTITIPIIDLLGMNFNTMTLSGIAFAVGALVDDAVIDVENVFRRLRQAGPGAQIKEVVFQASKEIRSAIIFATLIIVVVFVPLFFLTGLEGRFLRPLGTVYMIALGASLLVALTVTPVLCSLILPGSREIRENREGRLARFIKRVYGTTLRFCLPRRWLVLGLATMGLAASLVGVSRMGLNFLPGFNEGTLTISAISLPGTSLDLAEDLATQLERELLAFPEVTSTARRTGRAPDDEHIQGMNASEMEVNLDLKGRDMEDFLEELRASLAAIPGVNITIGQPISHRIDHMISGTRANIAIKVFGPDLARLQEIARRIESVMEGIPNVVDLSIESQPFIPEVRVFPRRADLARYGLSVEEVMDTLETARFGSVVGKVYEANAAFDIWVGMSGKDDMRALRNIRVRTSEGAQIPLSSLADIRREMGPESIARENGMRKAVVMCNVAGRDVSSVVEDIRQALSEQVELPTGYSIQYGGQAQSARQAATNLIWSSLGVLILVAVLLYAALGSIRAALLVLVNLPLALMGGVVGVYLDSGSLSIASMIGFIALFGIAVRNGLLMISHIQHLELVEGVTQLGEAVFRGAMERVIPILMTAVTAALALLPLALEAGEPGGEIEAPMAMVIICGLTTSTFLNLIVVPALYGRGQSPD